MCNQCDKYRAVAEQSEYLVDRVVEVGRGAFEHRLEVSKCPNCGQSPRSNLEDFLVKGCPNCDYTPSIDFVDPDSSSKAVEMSDKREQQILVEYHEVVDQIADRENLTPLEVHSDGRLNQEAINRVANKYPEVLDIDESDFES